MYDYHALAQKLEDWEEASTRFLMIGDIRRYLHVSRSATDKAIQIQRRNPELYQHCFDADHEGFYIRVSRGEYLRRYLARRDKWMASHTETIIGVGVRYLNAVDPNSIEGRLAPLKQLARERSLDAYQKLLTLQMRMTTMDADTRELIMQNLEIAAGLR